MIEVEVRGKLTGEDYEKLLAFMKANAEHTESHDREMYLLFDYPGYDPDPMTREIDIRLRNTNGNCEIIVKRKAGDHNIARHETSLWLRDQTLDNAKEIVKAFGCKTGLKMHRHKEIFMYKGVEWSLVSAPKSNFYFEVESMVRDDAEAGSVHEKLAGEAKILGLHVFNPEEMREYIYHLDREVNEIVEL